MKGQESLFLKEKQLDLFTCETCDFYSALAEPRIRSDNAVIYGYCFKHGDKNYNTNMGKGYAVFISGGCCKKWRKKRAAQAGEGGQNGN
jgi:hypothetical protein